MRLTWPKLTKEKICADVRNAGVWNLWMERGCFKGQIEMAPFYPLNCSTEDTCGSSRKYSGVTACRLSERGALAEATEVQG